MHDRETFGSWVREERRDLARFALLVTVNPRLAVSVTSRVLADLRHDFSTIAETGDPLSTTRQRIVVYAQRLASGPEGLPAASDLAPDAERHPAVARAWQVWTARPVIARACAALHLLDGLTLGETATTLGLTETAVRTQWERLRRDIGEVAGHRGRTTTASAGAEAPVRELLIHLAAQPLEVVDVPRTSLRHRLLLGLTALVTILVLALAIWPSSSTLSTTPSPSSTVAATFPPFTRTSAPGSPLPTQASLPAPDQGWRWLTTRDAAVQVPQTWVPTPRSTVWGWVEVSSDGRTCSASSIEVLACVSVAPSPMVVLEVWDPAEPVVSIPPSRVISRKVGSAWLIIGVPTEQDREVAHRILASARVMGLDPLGCPVRHRATNRPAGMSRPTPAWDVTMAVMSRDVLVCRYTRDDHSGRATLLSSTSFRQVEGRLFAEAAAGAPPESRRCPGTPQGERVVVLRFQTSDGVRELFVYPNGCTENHLDDGTTRREITPAFCVVLGLAVGSDDACGG